ncbi:MAG: hypothetical protein LBT75_00265, partial [Bacilli bacterium]|nr:hypothetical protein [Bacilli bacterium]
MFSTNKRRLLVGIIIILIVGFLYYQVLKEAKDFPHIKYEVNKNVPNYLVFKLGEPKPGYDTIKDIYQMKDGQFQKIKDNKIKTTLDFPQLLNNNVAEINGYVNCEIEQINYDGSVKFQDICNIKNAKKIDDGMITNIPFHNDQYIVTYLNIGYQKNGTYQSVLRILDNDYHFIGDIEIDAIVNNIFVSNNQLYYSKVDTKNEDQIVKKIMKYDLKTKQTSLYYNNTNKERINYLVFDQKDCYMFISENNYKSKDYIKVMRYDGHQMIDTNTKIDYIPLYYFQRDDGIYVDNDSNDETHDSGYLRIHNKKITTYERICHNHVKYYGMNHVYCLNEKEDGFIKYPYNSKK